MSVYPCKQKGCQHWGSHDEICGNCPDIKGENQTTENEMVMECPNCDWSGPESKCKNEKCPACEMCLTTNNRKSFACFRGKKTIGQPCHHGNQIACAEPGAVSCPAEPKKGGLNANET